MEKPVLPGAEIVPVVVDAYVVSDVTVVESDPMGPAALAADEATRQTLATLANEQDTALRRAQLAQNASDAEGQELLGLAPPKVPAPRQAPDPTVFGLRNGRYRPR